MKKILMMIGVFMVVVPLIGCALTEKNKPSSEDPFGIVGEDGLGDKAEADEGKMVGFSYSYQGSVGGGSYSYTIKDHEFSYELMGRDEYAQMRVPVGEELLASLKQLYVETEAYKWNGFSKTAMNVLDGNGFSVNFYFEDGKSCSARGSNAFPKNYGAFCSGMEELMRPLVADVVEQCRQKLIAEGFSGEITGIMLDFLQKGKSGSDQYSFHIYKTDREDSNNLDITIHSKSGDFLSVGDYDYFGHIDEKDLDFSRIKEMIEKYRLCEWQYYNVAAEDCNNAEWFQIEISFDDGKYLSAMGTEKPERYDEFRREFLLYMQEFIESIEDIYRPYS